MTMQSNGNRLVVVESTVLSELLHAAALFYLIAMQGRKQGTPNAPSEHELIVLHITLATVAKQLGVEEQLVYKSIIGPP